MVATYNKLRSRLEIRNYLDDPADATVVRKIAWVPMSENFLALLTFVSGTAVVTFKIFAATDVSGTGAIVVRAHATPTQADAAGDQLVLEVSAEEVLAALPAATHVAVEVDNGAAGDINVVTYVRSGQRFIAYGLTVDVIA